MSTVKTIKRGELARHSYVPPGGSTRNVLAKTSDDDADLEFTETALTLDSLRQTEAEVSAGVTPVNYSYPPYDIRRYHALAATTADQALDDLVAACHIAEVQGYIPGGTWLFTEEHDFPSNFCGLYGDGISATFLYFNGGEGETFISFPATVGALGKYSDLRFVAGAPGDSITTARSVARNGIYFLGGGGQGHLSNLKAENFQGFAFRFFDVWDTHGDHMITEECGNDTFYAWSCESSGSVALHNVWSRIQVELSHSKAFYIAGLNNEVFELHCERTTGNGSDYTHVFGGRLYLKGGRIEDTSNIKVLISPSEGSITDFLIQDGLTVFDAGDDPQPAFTLHNFTCEDARVADSNVRRFHFIDSAITGDLSNGCTAVNVLLSNTKVLGDVVIEGNGTKLVCDQKTRIDGTITNGGGTNSFEGHDCILDSWPAVINVRMRDSSVNDAVSTATSQRANVRGCTFSSTLEIAGNDTVWISDNCDYTGNVTKGGGTPGWAFGPHDRFHGTVATDFNAAPTGASGTFRTNQRHYRPNPASGQADYFVYSGAAWLTGPSLA
jgi:hypothetical protein